MACSNQINGLSVILNITYIGNNKFIYVGFRFLLNVLYFHLEKKSTYLIYYSLKRGCLNAGWGVENLVAFSPFIISRCSSVALNQNAKMCLRPF